MRTLLGCWSLAAALTLTSQITAAERRPYPECTAEPTESDVAAAKGAFQAGQASFNEADYERAITYWEDAYRRDCTAHALLLNLARAYELNGNKGQAVEALQTYLARKPESPQKDQIQRRIEVLNQQIDKETQTAVAPPPPEAAKPKDPAKPAEPTKAEPASKAPAPAAQGGSSWVGPVILGGVGLASAVTGLVVHWIGSQDESEAEEACPTRVDCPPPVEEKGNSGITKQKVGVGLMVGGAAAIGGGLAWYFFTRPDAKPATTAHHAPSSAESATRGARAPRQAKWMLLPDASGDYAGLTLLGDF